MVRIMTNMEGGRLPFNGSIFTVKSVTLAIVILGMVSYVQPQVTEFTTAAYKYNVGMCSFNVSEDAITQLNETLDGGSFFIYLNLVFPEPFAESRAYLSEDTNIINPLRWVFASEGKGNLLLALPFDFTQLSMGALKPGVNAMEVPIETDISCFEDRPDDQILQEMAQVMFEIASMASVESNSFSICIERQLKRAEMDKTLSIYLPGSSYILFQTATVYDCWADVGGAVSRGPVVVPKYRGLITCVYILGLILALYSPLAGIFFIRISPFPPSEVVVSHKTIAVHADLPLGLKYNLMFAGNDMKWIRLFRWLVIIIIFGVTPYIPYIAWSATDQLAIRMEAIDKAGVLYYVEIFGLQTLIELLYIATIGVILMFTFENYNLVTKRLQVRKVDRLYLGLVELPDELQIPEILEKENAIEERRAYGFFQAMIFRTFGLLNLGLYTYFFGAPFVWIQTKIQGPCLAPGVISTVLTVIIYTLALPFIFIYFLLNMTFYVIPLGDLILFCLRKFISNKVTARDVLVAIGIVIMAVTVFFKFIAVFVYIGELIGFTFVGFLLHTEEIGEYILVGVAIAGFILNAVTGYYDGYCQLMMHIVEKADERDEELEKEKHIEQTVSGVPATFQRTLYFNDQGVPFIKQDLFERVVNKYRPVNEEIFKIVLQFITIGTFVLLGLSIIKTIDGFSDLPATVEFFATVLVAGVFPLVVLILRSPGKVECLDEGKWRQLEADLDYYAINGHFKSEYLHY